MRFFLIFTCLMLVSIQPISGQSISIDSLTSLYNHIYRQKSDSSKIIASRQFTGELANFCTLNPAKELPGITKNLAILHSNDNSLQIISYNVPLSDGKHHYECLILKKHQNNFRFWILQDSSESILSPKNVELSPKRWFGALYYQLISENFKNCNYYTLLGWDGNNQQFARKIIEIMWFDEEGELHFGMPVFAGSRDQRVFYEYAQGAAFTLRYEEQIFYRRKWWSRKPVSYVRPLILFNRLVTTAGNTKNLPQFNYPAGNILDAWLFENKKWKILRDVDARNPETELDRKPIKPPRQGLKEK